MHRELPSFISTRGGVVAAPGRRRDPLLAEPPAAAGHRRHRRRLHTRFPIGISFPAGSGLVAFAAATGVMPLDMPGIGAGALQGGEMQPGHHPA